MTLSPRLPADGEAGLKLASGAVLGPVLLLVIVGARLGTSFELSAHAHVFVAQELALVLAAALLAGVAAWVGLRPARDAISLTVAALVAIEVASGVAASDPWLALRSATVWIAGLVVFVVARALPAESRAIGLGWLLFPLGVVAVSVIAESLGLVRLSASHHAPGGLLGERNVAAELLVVGMPLALHVALTDAWRKRAWFVLTVSTAAIVSTRTRSAWLAALVCVPLFLWSARHAGHRVRSAGATIALGILLALALPTRLRWQSKHPYRETLVHLVDRTTPSANGRLVQYATTAKMALAHPALGVGPGNWAAQYVAFAKPDDPTVHPGLSPVNRLPNSDALGFAAERGLPAFVLLVVLGVLLARQRESTAEEARLRRATLGALVITASLDAVLQTPAALFFASWVVGSSTGTARAHAPRHEFFVAAALLVAAAVPAGLRLRAVALAAHARGSEDLERATKLDPGDVALRLFTAESWIADGRCDRARPHLDAVARFSPVSPARAEFATRCANASDSQR